MGKKSKHQSIRYNSYGNVAYAPQMDGNVVAAPREVEYGYPLPKRRVQERTQARPLTRTRVQTREAGAGSPFAIVGFLAVGIFAALLMMSYVQFTGVADNMVSMQKEYDALQTDNGTLSAQYDQVFNLKHIEESIGTTMIRPSEDQLVYLDLSQPDSVVVFDEIDNISGLDGITQGVGNIIAQIVAYF